MDMTIRWSALCSGPAEDVNYAASTQDTLGDGLTVICIHRPKICFEDENTIVILDPAQGGK
jgi:hypothetical protein